MQKQSIILKRLVIVLLLYIAVFIAIFLLSYIGYTCPFRKYLGINCIGCGMTRAFFALINFNFAEAFCLNPLIYPLSFSVFAVSVYYVFFYKNKISRK